MADASEGSAVPQVPQVPQGAHAVDADDGTGSGATADQEVHRLGPHLGGRWLVTTQGSEHIWDLDLMTYLRLPGEGRGQFDQDRQVVAIGRVAVWPEVGSCSLLFYDDPDRPHTHEQWRKSSRIRRIRRLPEADAS
ncbi:MAG: hypothetical protein ACXVGA_04385 [Mycobacteriaceae bacterium]